MEYITVKNTLEKYVDEKGEQGLSDIMGILFHLFQGRIICRHYLLRREDLKTELDNAYADKKRLAEKDLGKEL